MNEFADANRRVGFLTGVLVVLLVVLACEHAQAATINVQHDGVTQFCATGGPFGFDGVSNYTGTCTTPPPPGCVADATRTRATAMSIGYGGVMNTGNVVADMTQFASMYGRSGPTALPPFKLFPLISGLGPTYRWTQRGIYVAQGYVSPPSTPGFVWTGSLAVQSNNARGCFNTNGTPGPCGQPFLDISMSTQCNDFNPATAAFVSLHVPSDGQPHARWWQDANAPGLIPNTPYFLNVRMSDPADYWRTVFVIWYGAQVRG